MRHPPAPAAPLVSLHGQATLSMPREAPLGTCECCPRCPPSRPPAWAAKTRSRRVRRPSVEIREVGSEEGGRPLVTLGLGCGVGGTGTSDAVIYSFAASLAPCPPPPPPPSHHLAVALPLSPHPPLALALPPLALSLPRCGRRRCWATRCCRSRRPRGSRSAPASAARASAAPPTTTCSRSWRDERPAYNIIAMQQRARMM